MTIPMNIADKFLPNYQFSERHCILIDAPPHAVLNTIDSFSANDDQLIVSLIAIREAPARLAGAFGFQPGRVSQQAFGMSNFAKLGERDDQVVYGLVGRFWRPSFGLEQVTGADGFLAFEQPGVAKLVMSFSLAQDETGPALLTTETRVFCPDRKSLLLFSLYWMLIRAPSGLIRRRMLAAIKGRAERLCAPSK
jgi:hypothetical protein